MLPIPSPLSYFHDNGARALDSGFIYIGQVNQNPETAPQTIYWDAEGTQPAAQPLRTSDGYIVRNGAPANVFILNAYSMTIKNKAGGLIFYGPDSTQFDSNIIAGGLINNIQRIVQNLAELRTLSKSVYAFAFVAGNTVKGDGGGGDYYYDASDITSTDNGGDVIVAADGGRWKFMTMKFRPAGFFTGNGSKAQRFGDKVFMGDAVAGDGAFPGTAHDWLYTYMNPYFSAAGNTPPSNTTGVVALAGGTGSPFPGEAILGGASSAAAASPGGNAIGVQGYGVAQSGLGGDFAWGFYGEGHRATSTTGNCYGAEICVVNRGTVKVNTPYFSESGATIGLQVDSGVGFTSAQMSGLAKASSAIVVVENADGSIPFLNGLVFQATSLDGTNGNDAGHGDAIVMAKGHRVRWYKPGNVSGPTITSDVNAGVNTNLAFTDFGLQVQNSSGQAIAQFANSAASKNGFNFNTADGSGHISIEAVGADTNIDVKLTPKGTGLVKFGTFTSSSGSPNGFILVLDAAGNQRKLATIP
jgi:hypothetical protein